MDRRRRIPANSRTPPRGWIRSQRLRGIAPTRYDFYSQALRRCRLRRKTRDLVFGSNARFFTRTGIHVARKRFLERVAVGFAGPDSQRTINRRHEYLAVADLSGACAGANDLDGLIGEIGCDRDLDPQLRQEIHHILRAAIDFSVALLTSVTLDLGHGHAADPDRGERLAHFVELEGFDNGDNELHVQAFISDFERSVTPSI